MTHLDKIIFFTLMLCSVLSIVFTNIIFAGSTATEAVITVNGKEYGRYSIEEKNTKILDVKTEFGYNKIEISGGRVRVLETSCPDRLETKGGAINSVGEMLVCLPNRLVIKINGEKGVDNLAY